MARSRNPHIIQHYKPGYKKRLKKDMLVNEKNKKVAEGNRIMYFSTPEDRENLLLNVSSKTGYAALPLNMLFTGVESEEKQQGIFNLRESMLQNASTVFFYVSKMQEGSIPSTNDEINKTVSLALTTWFDQVNQINTHMTNAIMAMRENKETDA